MATIRIFEDIEAWQKARKLAQEIYILTEKGKNYKYGIRLLDKNGIVLGVNKTFCELFDMEEKDFTL